MIHPHLSLSHLEILTLRFFPEERASFNMKQEATRTCEGPSANASRIGVTCMFTAALRHVETSMIPDPIIVDHLAPHLCGESALQLAIKELHDLRYLKQLSPSNGLYASVW